MADFECAKRVYKSRPISLSNKVTSFDFVELDMLEFDVILGMNWLLVCFSTDYCRTRVFKFHFLNQSVLE